MEIDEDHTPIVNSSLSLGCRLLFPSLLIYYVNLID